MSKLTVESIIRIYGSKVKEVKVFNEKKRAQAENFLQIEPVAFALADEPDVLRIYVDKESAEASLDGTLQDDIEPETQPITTEGGTVKTILLEDEKAIELYYKLHKCLKKAMGNEEKLGCHVNNIIVKLAKSIESKETWYDERTDTWCDYFLGE